MKFEDMTRYYEPVKKGGQWRAECGAMSAYGRNKADATENLLLAMVDGVGGTYAPQMIFFHGYVCLIWREPALGWGYVIRPVGEGTLRSPYSLLSLYAMTYIQGGCEDCERAARRHLAQYVDGEVSPEEAALVILDAHDRAEFMRQVEFRRKAEEIMYAHKCTWTEACEVVSGIRRISEV